MSYLGDGGEDISCRLEAAHLEIEEQGSGVFPAHYVDEFLVKLKCFFLEGLVFPRRHNHMDSRYSLNSRIFHNFNA